MPARGCGMGSIRSFLFDVSRQRQRAPSPTQLGFTRVGHLKFVEVGYIRLRWERVGVRGYGLSLGCKPSPGAARRPLPMGEVRRRAWLPLYIANPIRLDLRL